ncbi:hypothetical protein ACHAXR_009958 [Thalassiosira sp. AJA248-18]
MTKSSPATTISCIAAGVGGVMTAEQTKAIPAFQTPIIFPLLWMAKRLTQHRRIGFSQQLIPLMPPLASRLKSIVSIGHNKMDDNIEQLFDWLDDMEGSSSHVKIDSNNQGLRGMYATKDIKRGQIVIEIPFDAALMTGDTLWSTIYDDFDDVPGSDDWEEDDLDDVYQGLNLLQSFVNDQYYAPYIANLPEKPSSGDEAGLTPDFWSKDVILGLEVPSFIKQILDRKQIVQEVAKKNNMNENELRWATWMVRSRRFTTWNMVDDPNGEEDEALFGVFPIRRKPIEQIQGFLLPLIDMANHAHDPNAELKISVNRWTREFDDTSTFALRALRPIKKGEEVTLLYGDGDRSSLVMLEKYGFFLEGNEADKDIDWDELKPEFTTSLEVDEAELATMLQENDDAARDESKPRVLSKTTNKIKTIVSKIQDYEPHFSPKLDDLHLVGNGIRQKVGIKVYAVAMYGSLALLEAAASFSSSRDELRHAARKFDEASPRTTFAIEMILQADANTIAEAISESVRLRHDGPMADVQYLEALIAEGVKERGGHAAKGSILQFDCTEEGVSVSVNGAAHGQAKFKGLGSAFVDVFMDGSSVSPSLVDNCLERGKDRVGGRSGVSATAANMAEQKNQDSRRIMLSLRVLMKRLSCFHMDSAAPTSHADETVVNGGTVEQQEEIPELEVPNNEKGSDPLEITASVGSNEVDTEILALLPNDEIETAPSIDEEVDSSELAVSAEEVALDDGDTPESPPIDEVEKVMDTTTSTLPPSEKALEDSTTFDADVVSSRIRQLEAEIEAEIARVKSQDEQPTDVSTGAQDTTIAVDPVPASSNIVAAQDSAEGNQAEVKLKLEEEERQRAANEAAEKAAAEAQQRFDAVESKMQSLKDKATGVEFDPKLEDAGIFLCGVGVRKKAIINVYSVAMYSSPSALEALSPFPRGKQQKEAKTALQNAARTFDADSPMTTFVLKMVFKADGQTIAGAIAEGVKPRYSGPATDVKELESLIIEGVKGKGGQATKGTVFRFDCTEKGVRVSVDGNEQGMAIFEGMGSAFVDVFMDTKAVSPPLIDSCLNTWCGSGL